MAVRPVGTLVIGGGQAGADLVWALGDLGYGGTVALLGDEASPPYERPPLSKEILSGDMDARRLTLRSAQSYAERGISLVAGARVVALDVAARRVTTADGTDRPYEHCVLATGARPRLPDELTGVGAHVVRTVTDAATLGQRVRDGDTAVVVGGGFLGLEIAASLVGRGVSVTVLEQADRLMPGRVSDHTAAVFQRLHTENGVRLRQGDSVAAVATLTAGGSRHVLTTQAGATLACDHLVVAIGAVPNTELARDAGVHCGRGVLVDREWRTSADGLFAIGDVASRSAGDGSEMRVESVQHATTSARAAAHVIAGRPVPAPKVPTFWTGQHGVRLQTAGFVDPTAPVMDEVDGEPSAYVVRRHQHGRLAALEVVGRPADFVRGIAELTAALRAPSPEEVPVS